MIAFIIGSPRSGTTILGTCLNQHSEIAHFYEPYFIWDFFTGPHDNDIRSPEDLTKTAICFIRRNFQTFSKKTKKPLVVDKSPENCFRIPFLYRVYPDAKWIHLIRDGRDVTLSISKEWKRRRQTILRKDYRHHFLVLKRVFTFQPFWYFRFLQIFYELKTGASFNPFFYLNKSKWKGLPHYGPRFFQWEAALKNHTFIQFNALQWLESVIAAQEGLNNIPSANILTVRYETFISQPEIVLGNIVRFLGCKSSNGFIRSIPKIHGANHSKWVNELPKEHIKAIGPILSSKLVELKYEETSDWYVNV
jgi:hypothetical protein